MQRKSQLHTIGMLAAGAALVLGSIFSLVPASAQVAQSPLSGAHGNRLGLTPAQREQARAIFREARKEARGVLTPEQRVQWKTGIREERTTMRKDIANVLGLSPGQRAQVKTIREGAKIRVDAVKADMKLSASDRDAQLRDIHQAARMQMKSVLTPAQQQHLRGAIRQEIRAQRPVRTVLHSLNLSNAQKTQLKAIHQQSRETFRAMLTPEQVEKLNSLHHAHHSI